MLEIIKDLNKVSSPKRAKVNQWFFKTGPGQYGEGDIFLGVTMPDARKVAKKYSELSIKEVEKLLHSKIHEQRMVALLIWTYQFEKADEKIRKKIYQTYLKNTKWINNWDLVDVTTPKIVGVFLLDKNKNILYKLAKSKNLWEKRIAILATFPFIRNEQFKDTLEISSMLLSDGHDLMHKAVGWMLREVGKRDEKVLKKFLKDNYSDLPRTTLRYAIERFPEDLRKKFLLGDI
jgi:3-methyladenine DNA glycosylase AlkD